MVHRLPEVCLLVGEMENTHAENYHHNSACSCVKRTCTVLSSNHVLGTVSAVTWDIFRNKYVLRPKLLMNEQSQSYPLLWLVKEKVPWMSDHIKDPPLLWRIWELSKKERKQKKPERPNDPCTKEKKRNRQAVWVTFGITSRRVKMLRIRIGGFSMWQWWEKWNF